MRGKWRSGLPVLAFLLLTAVWGSTYAAKLDGREPYPAVIQPGFGAVRDGSAPLKCVEYRYVAVMADGTRQPFDYHDVLPPSGRKTTSIARRLFTQEVTSDPATRAWLRGRLARLDLTGQPVALEIERVRVRYDITTGQREELSTRKPIVIPLRDPS